MSATDSRDNLDGSGIPSDPAAAFIRALELLERNVMLKMRNAGPAQVVSYDATTQKADLLLGFLPIEYIQGQPVPREPIPLPSVPVSWQGDSRTAYFTTPLLPGATGLVVFSDRCLAKWLELGIPVDPKNYRLHDAADGTFFPGAHPDTAPIVPPTDQTAAVIEGPLIKVGRAATSFMLHGTEVHAAFTAWCSALATAGATAASAAPDPSGAIHDAYIASVTSATATLAATLATWLSTRAQVV